jgi:UDP-sugar transporter A1/2/3
MHSLVLRFSRTVPGPRYLASAAVIFTEAAKILVCMGVMLSTCVSKAKNNKELAHSVCSKGKDLLCNSLPMAVPAGLYVMQQTLVIVAATHLDVVTFQICSQMKVFPTAVFASLLLGQHLSFVQWLSLPVLAGGVSFVTGSSSSVHQPTGDMDWHLGVAACLVSGISSAFAGVWFEKYVKGAETSSLWIRNCQLSLYGLPLAVLSLITADRAELLEGGFFQGFNLFTWLAIALQAFGGIVVGMVVKYADNILKNFANALSVICTVICAIPIFGQYPSPWSIVGESPSPHPCTALAMCVSYHPSSSARKELFRALLLLSAFHFLGSPLDSHFIPLTSHLFGVICTCRAAPHLYINIYVWQRRPQQQ